MTEEQESFETQEQVEQPEVVEQQAGDASSEQEPEPKPINQEAVNQAINKQHRLYKEELEKRQEVERKLQEYEAKVKEIERKEQTVNVPPLPEPYDEEYDRKMRDRESALRKQAEIEAHRKIQEKQAKEAQYQVQLTEQQKQVERTENYLKSAEKLGVDKTALQSSGTIVDSYIGNRQGITNFLLESEKGPLIVQHLSENHVELAELQKLDDISAAVYIAKVIEPKLTPKSQNITNAPDPVEPIQGAGAGESRYVFSQGATFE